MGSGKTMCVLRLCEWLKDEYSMAVITNDIYTREDAEFLLRAGQRLVNLVKPRAVAREKRRVGQNIA